MSIFVIFCFSFPLSSRQFKGNVTTQQMSKRFSTSVFYKRFISCPILFKASRQDICINHMIERLIGVVPSVGIVHKICWETRLPNMSKSIYKAIQFPCRYDICREHLQIISQYRNNSPINQCVEFECWISLYKSYIVFSN